MCVCVNAGGATAASRHPWRAYSRSPPLSSVEEELPSSTANPRTRSQARPPPGSAKKWYRFTWPRHLPTQKCPKTSSPSRVTRMRPLKMKPGQRRRMLWYQFGILCWRRGMAADAQHLQCWRVWLRLGAAGRACMRACARECVRAGGRAGGWAGWRACCTHISLSLWLSL